MLLRTASTNNPFAFCRALRNHQHKDKGAEQLGSRETDYLPIFAGIPTPTAYLPNLAGIHKWGQVGTFSNVNLCLNRIRSNCSSYDFGISIISCLQRKPWTADPGWWDSTVWLNNIATSLQRASYFGQAFFLIHLIFTFFIMLIIWNL